MNLRYDFNCFEITYQNKLENFINEIYIQRHNVIYVKVN